VAAEEESGGWDARVGFARLFMEEAGSGRWVEGYCWADPDPAETLEKYSGPNKKQTPSDMKCWDLCPSEASEAVGMLAQRPAAPCFLFFVLAYLYVHDTSDIQGK
jgi:hypothetical protein